MSFAFLKMNGLGNDFVVLDARAQKLSIDAAAARRIADRNRGVGCDQLLLIEPGTGGADAVMRIWNPDGSVAKACGNGARCVADLLLSETKKPSIKLSTAGGLITCVRTSDGRVTVDMGEPKLEWQDIPLAERMDTRTLDIRLGPIDAPVLIGPSAVNMGNPHCVFFVTDIAKHDPTKIGPMIENHPLFPDRANVSFAQVKPNNEIRLRVWERGVGVTLACGTAACATTVAASRKKLIGREARIELDGGVLEIEWREADNHVYMTGPTELNYAGSLDERYFAS